MLILKMDKNTMIVAVVAIVALLIFGLAFILTQNQGSSITDGGPQSDGATSECLAWNTYFNDYTPLMKLCSNDRECKDYISTFQTYFSQYSNSMDLEDVKCVSTTFVPVPDYFCGTDYDCYSEFLDLMTSSSSQSIPQGVKDEIASVFRCNRGRCQMSYGVYEAWARSSTGTAVYEEDSSRLENALVRIDS